MKEFNVGDTLYKMTIRDFGLDISSVRIVRKDVRESVLDGKYNKSFYYYNAKDENVYTEDYFSTKKEAAINSQKEYQKIFNGYLEDHENKLIKFNNLLSSIESHIN
jgi:hypothetical protein